MVLFLLLVSGCASKIRFTPVTELENESFSSRATPARVTAEPEEALSRKDYVKIGWIGIWDILQTCWEPDCASYICPKETIKKESDQNDFTEQLMRESASVGGDLLLLSHDKVIFDRPTTKEGKCLARTETGREIVVYDQDYRTGRTYRRTYHEHMCAAYEILHGKQCSLVSSGTVWRHESLEVINKLKYQSMKKTYFTVYENLHVLESDRVKVGDKYGFKDKAGHIIVKPQFTDAHYVFSDEGLVAVAIGEEGNKLWGFINRTGQWVIRPKYQDVRAFHGGRAPVKVKDKWSYIDAKGTLITKPQFDEAYLFIGGVAKVKVGNKEGYINETGELFMEP